MHSEVEWLFILTKTVPMSLIDVAVTLHHIHLSSLWRLDLMHRRPWFSFSHVALHSKITDVCNRPVPPCVCVVTQISSRFRKGPPLLDHRLVRLMEISPRLSREGLASKIVSRLKDQNSFYIYFSNQCSHVYVVS